MRKPAAPILLIRAGLLLAVLAVFGQAGGYGFIELDDPAYVASNPHVLGGPTLANVRWAFTDVETGNWHPVTWLTLMLDATWSGADPRGYHVGNVAIHAASVLLLFELLRRTTGAVGRSAFVACVFAIHPLRAESVVWVAERKDVLATFFWLVTTIAYVRWAERRGTARAAIVLLAFALGLMSKPMLVTLPLVLCLMDVWPLGRVPMTPAGALASLRGKVPLLCLSAAFSAIALFSQSRGGAMGAADLYPWSGRLANAAVSYVAYLGKLAWPSGLCLPYAYDPASLTPLRAAAALALLIAVSILVARAARSRPYLAVGWGWYLLALLPVIGLVQVGNQAMADRYTYVPLIGPLIMIAWGANDLLRRRVLLGGLAGLSVLALAGCGFVQVRHWRTSRALFTHSLEVDPRNSTAHTCLAMGFAEEGRVDEAIHHHREAIALAPGNTFSRKHLGILLTKRSEDSEAVPLLQASLFRYPDDAVALGFLGTSLLRLGRTAEAQAAFESSLRLEPNDMAVHQNLGVLFLQQRKLDRAIEHFTEAVRLSPGDASARAALAEARALARQEPRRP